MAKEELKFSGLAKGYINNKGEAVLQVNPDKELSLQQVHDYIVSDAAKDETERLRQITDHSESQKFKKLNFRVALFYGLFSKRNARGLYKASGHMVIDIDGMETPEAAIELKRKLCADKHYVTALCFISPSGYGVKWVVERQPLKDGTYKDEMNRMYNYVAFEYGIAIDTSGSDICRACFLPYDKDCFINSKYLKK